MPKQEIDKRVRNAAEILELTDFLDRKPRQLSGGQRQRVAMGRCIVREPKVFLFDEPLSNLDAKLRVQMRLELRNLHEKLGITSVYVTHDQVEAMTLGDKLIIMDDGNVEQIGSPLEVYEKPATRFVAGFIGSPAMNFFQARISKNGSQVEVLGTEKLSLLKGSMHKFAEQEVVMGIRPEHFELSDNKASTLEIIVDHVETLGADTLVHGHFGEDNTNLTLRLTDVHHFKKGTTLPLIIPPEKLHFFDKVNGNRIGD
jgi:sn-glycerol 3-phosphate transport system ATP-binding protein